MEMTAQRGNWIACAFGTLGALIRERWRRLQLLVLAGVIAYQVFLLLPFAVVGSFPNYFKVYDAGSALVESFRLGPPLSELWPLLLNQPVYEFGIRDRFGFISLQFVATPHSLLTMILLPLLVALSLLLLLRMWTVLRQGRRMLGKVAGVSASTVAGLFGASASAVACCGASSGPVLLTLLGIGFGTAGVIVDYAELLEIGGFVVLAGNLVGLAGWLGTWAFAGRAGDQPVERAAIGVVVGRQRVIP